MSLLLENIATYLASNSVGTLGRDIFVGYMPESPPNVVVISPTGGQSPGLDGKEYPSVQIMVRDTSSRNGLAKAENIRNLLHKRAEITQALRGYCVAEESSPLQIGRTENGEFLFVNNFSWLVTV